MSVNTYIDVCVCERGVSVCEYMIDRVKIECCESLCECVNVCV